MTEHKKRPKKTELACQWVEEDSFKVLPNPPAQARKQKGRPDTAFALKPKGSAPSMRTPGS